MGKKINLVWFRRDLRLEDHTALNESKTQGLPILPLFIFDDHIVDSLEKDDARVNFIYDTLKSLDERLKEFNAGFLIRRGKPKSVFKEILGQYPINEVFLNKDYEPYAIQRDQSIISFLEKYNIKVNRFKDQVIFEENEILKPDGKPYTVFTPYKKRWLENFHPTKAKQTKKTDWFKPKGLFPSKEKLGIEKSKIQVKDFQVSGLIEYDKKRDFPALDSTSYLGIHLRFGIVSIRDIVSNSQNKTFLNELIWREFFMQILFHFPHVVHSNFKPKYDTIQWRNNKEEFQLWCNGKTGYPIVDAGMKQLNQTGYMHNRVRMITASFLCKHLLIDWRWGEAYFAKKLLDYDLSANNGNWQWSAGTGCDAAPYFRIFNPTEQQKKFDKKANYTRKWVLNLDDFSYPKPMIDHKFARERALKAYKIALNTKNA